jgi:hypothetical protein
LKALYARCRVRHTLCAADHRATHGHQALQSSCGHPTRMHTRAGHAPTPHPSQLCPTPLSSTRRANEDETGPTHTACRTGWHRQQNTPTPPTHMHAGRRSHATQQARRAARQAAVRRCAVDPGLMACVRGGAACTAEEALVTRTAVHTKPAPPHGEADRHRTGDTRSSGDTESEAAACAQCWCGCSRAHGCQPAAAGGRLGGAASLVASA